ncbi:hypothetical protein BDFG_09131 [Blastomyces dermatitidis ATCC 26199]|nr:hypothetical protein BDFG_09131 [Blastomyces dermatitidis ATCC 26199]
MAVRGAENRLNTDELISRRDNISLQGTVTTAAAVKEVEEGEDVIMRVMLLWLIDTAAFNLAFLTVMKAAVTS